LFVGFLTIIAAIANYESSNLDRKREAAERSYYELVGDVSQDSVRARIGAIHRIPRLLIRQVPASSDIGFFSSIRVLAGGHVPEVAEYHDDMKELVQGLFGEIRAGNSTDSKREVSALVDILVELGGEGWYRAQPSPQNKAREEGLQWIWDPPLDPSQVSPVSMFSGLPLGGLDLSNFNLYHADFSGSELTGANFNVAHLWRADLSKTCANKPEFGFANLGEVTFASAVLQGGHFESASLIDADTSYASFAQSHFEDAHLEHLKGISTDFSGSKFMGAHLPSVVLRSSYFDGADFTIADLAQATFDASMFRHAIFRGANLAGASFRNADLRYADFHAADLTGIDLENADLRNANLSGVKHLQDAKTVTGANFAGAIGLPAIVRKGLIQRGAVFNGSSPRPSISAPDYPCDAIPLIRRKSQEDSGQAYAPGSISEQKGGIYSDASN
jgi:uncharacterized protein YjbI with pentapeptide repeats